MTITCDKLQSSSVEARRYCQLSLLTTVQFITPRVRLLLTIVRLYSFVSYMYVITYLLILCQARRFTRRMLWIVADGGN